MRIYIWADLREKEFIEAGTEYKAIKAGSISANSVMLPVNLLMPPFKTIFYVAALASFFISRDGNQIACSSSSSSCRAS